MHLLRDAWKILKKYYGIPVLIFTFLHLTHSLPHRRLRALDTETQPKSKARGHSEMLLLGARRLEQSPIRRANTAKVAQSPRRVSAVNVAHLPNQTIIAMKAAQSPRRANAMKVAQPSVPRNLKPAPSPPRGTVRTKAKHRPMKAGANSSHVSPLKSAPRTKKNKDGGKRRKRTVIIGRRADPRREKERRRHRKPVITTTEAATTEAATTRKPRTTKKPVYHPPKFQYNNNSMPPGKEDFLAKLQALSALREKLERDEAKAGFGRINKIDPNVPSLNSLSPFNSVVKVQPRKDLPSSEAAGSKAGKKPPPKTVDDLEKEAEAYLESIDEEYARLCHEDAVIGYDLDTLGEDEEEGGKNVATDNPNGSGSMEYVEAEEGEYVEEDAPAGRSASASAIAGAGGGASASAKAGAGGAAAAAGTEEDDGEGAEDENKKGEGDDENEEPTASDLFLDFQDEVRETLRTKFADYKEFSNPLLRKEISIILREGQGSLDDADFNRMYGLQTKFEEIYNKGCTCEYKHREKCRGCSKKQYCTLKLEPEVDEIMAKSRDYDELVHYFNSWHWALGTQIQASEYKEYFELNNMFAQGNNYETFKHVWAELYDPFTPGWNADTFTDSVMSLWEEIKPHYKVLHSYVRMKLSEFPAYKGKIQRCGPIPVHLLGNMFGQTWVNIDDITKPYPNTPSLDASAEMRRQGYTPKKMLELADEFFQSLGLMKLPPEFWNNSVYTKPPNVGGCHPAAYDMGLGRYGQDYRLSMCATVTQKDFSTMHHELGHIQYMMQFANYRYAFRQAANPGFDESIGDALAMAVVTPEHLQCKLGLNLGVKVECDKSKQSKNFQITETDINFLYLTALESLAFFPFSIVIDFWRYLIMDDKLEAEDFNDKWWQMRRKIQGVVPPSRRPSNFFDAGAKFHVVRHNSYLRYFMSTILQFDFYESMCIAAGEYNPKDPNGKPVYRCDFAGSKKAGEKMGNMLKMGSQRPWPEALKAITGHSNVTVQPLLNYFKPLLDKLKELLKEGGQLDCLTHDTWS